mmetsp:Transcript_376/g.485  ORF Transcript_376/g.485 Transcript_376/m.485 type:complete len:83 (-) Transcript_376:70-318(-)
MILDNPTDQGGEKSRDNLNGTVQGQNSIAVLRKGGREWTQVEPRRVECANGDKVQEEGRNELRGSLGRLPFFNMTTTADNVE